MADDKWKSGPPKQPHKWLLCEHGKKPRWLEETEVIELDIPDVQIPTEVPMKNYKWKPTYHGSLIPKKDETPPPAPKPGFDEFFDMANEEYVDPVFVLNGVKGIKMVDVIDLKPQTHITGVLEEIKAYEMPVAKIIAANSVKDWEEKEFLDQKVETVVQTSSSRTKTKAKKSVAKAPKKKPSPAIFQWTFQSSQDVGGQKAVYSTLLRSNGDMTCNCPGWIFKRGTDRFCKHTKMVEVEAKGLYKDHKAGKELPAMELVGAGNIAIAANPKKEGDLKYGRRIILD